MKLTMKYQGNVGGLIQGLIKKYNVPFPEYSDPSIIPGAPAASAATTFSLGSSGPTFYGSLPRIFRSLNNSCNPFAFRQQSSFGTTPTFGSQTSFGQPVQTSFGIERYHETFFCKLIFFSCMIFFLMILLLNFFRWRKTDG